MQRHKGILAGMAVAGSALVAGLAFAATQGTLGSTSTGSVNITSVVGNAVQISGLADIGFPPTPQGAPVPSAIDQTACIFSTPGSYHIQASSQNVGGGSIYQLHNAAGGAGSFITYTVTWFTQATGGTGTALTLSGTPYGQFSGASSTSVTCNGSANAHMEIAIDSTTWNNAITGTFSDTLTLVVSPL